MMSTEPDYGQPKRNDPRTTQELMRLALTEPDEWAAWDPGHASEKLQDLFRTENDRQFLRLLGSGDDVFQVPIPAKGDFVEEAKGGDGETDRIG